MNALSAAQKLLDVAASKTSDYPSGMAGRNEALEVAASELASLRPLEVGDRVELDGRLARLSPVSFGPRPRGEVASIGARGGIVVRVYSDGVERRIPREAIVRRVIDLLDVAAQIVRDSELELELEAEEELEERVVIVVPCGAAKLDVASTAGTLYVGSLHRSARAAADRLKEELGGEVLILSALHGLVSLYRVLEPYSVTIGDPEAITTEELASQARSLELEKARTIVLGGRRYVELLASTGIEVEAPLASDPGIGYMRGHLARIAREGSSALAPEAVAA